jgi:hypothetical protein
MLTKKDYETISVCLSMVLSGIRRAHDLKSLETKLGLMDPNSPFVISMKKELALFRELKYKVELQALSAEELTTVFLPWKLQTMM